MKHQNPSVSITGNWKLNQVYNAANKAYVLVVKQAISAYYHIKTRKGIGKCKSNEKIQRNQITRSCLEKPSLRKGDHCQMVTEPMIYQKDVPPPQ